MAVNKESSSALVQYMLLSHTQHNNADSPSHLPIYVCIDNVYVEADKFCFINDIQFPQKPVNCIDIAKATKEDTF